MSYTFDQYEVDFWNAIGKAFPTAAAEFVAAAAEGIEPLTYDYDSTVTAYEGEFTPEGFSALLGACTANPEDMMVVDSAKRKGQRMLFMNGIYLQRVRAAVSAVIEELVVPQMHAVEKPRGILIPVSFGR
jgi:hypothetical protein